VESGDLEANPGRISNITDLQLDGKAVQLSQYEKAKPPNRKEAYNPAGSGAPPQKHSFPIKRVSVF